MEMGFPVESTVKVSTAAGAPPGMAMATAITALSSWPSGDEAPGDVPPGSVQLTRAWRQVSTPQVVEFGTAEAEPEVTITKRPSW